MLTGRINNSVGRLKDMCIKSNKKDVCQGFTLIEVMMVVIILAIAAAITVPLAISGSGTQLKAAANIIAADLEYAKSMAISTGKRHSVVFNAGTESYQIEDANGMVINHPVTESAQYIVDFASDSRLDKVDISSVNIDAGSTVKFDYLGSPYNSADNALNTGTITLTAGTSTMNVNIEPVTGYITIN
jgi:prepilin-type N-terminal cleavage/methylation domain-containing protein